MKRLVLLGACLFAVSAFAHDDHCHTKDSKTGKGVDDKTLKDEKSCTAKGGHWVDHHVHCHSASADGGHVDMAGVKTEKECKAKQGIWNDHDHDEP